MRLLLLIITLAAAGCKNDREWRGIESHLKNDLPGWTMIDTADYSKTWWSFYDRDHVPQFITIDINDDQYADHVLLLKKENELRMVVLIGAEDGSFTHWMANDFQPVYLNEVNDVQYGLAIEPPAQIDVLEPEAKSLVLRSNAIAIMEMEQRARIYHWQDGTIKTFYAK